MPAHSPIAATLTRNSLANFAGQGYAAVAALVAMPLFLQLLGAEAFGIIGIFLLLQAWSVLADVGLSPTMARQIAFWKGRAGGLRHLAHRARTYERSIAGIAAVLTLVAVALSEVAAESWLAASSLTVAERTSAFVLMAVTVGLRMLVFFYRYSIRGFEDQVWLAVADISLASLRYFGVLLPLILLNRSIHTFIGWQLAVAIAEILVYRTRQNALLSSTDNDASGVVVSADENGAVRRFAIGIAYTTGLWTVVTQSDRLILSFVLPMNEFAYFSLVALAASGLAIVTTPVSNALVPRLTGLYSTGDQESMLRVYRDASQVVSVIALAAATWIVLYGESLVFAWTGNTAAAAWSADVLYWFALGHALLAITAFQFYLQTATGELRLHVVGSTLSALIQVPALYYGAIHYGAVGAGIAWCAVRFLFFAFWIPVVHRSVAPGMHGRWLAGDVLPVAAAACVSGWLMNSVVLVPSGAGRAESAFYLVAAGVLLLAGIAAGSSVLRRWLMQRIRNRG